MIIRLMQSVALGLLVSAAAPAPAPSPDPHQQQQQPAFPGAANFPLKNDGLQEILDALYPGRVWRSTHIAACHVGCPVSVAGFFPFRDDAGWHLGLVIVAKPRRPAHADGVVLGIADLLNTSKGYVIAAGTPELADEGSWGEPPQMQVMHAELFGMALITMPAASNQGEMVQDWNLYLNIGGKFQRVISFPAIHDRSDACQPSDSPCRRLDFSTQTALYDHGRQGLSVRAIRRDITGAILEIKDICIAPPPSYKVTACDDASPPFR
jgi:hypothetical protein